MKYIKDYLHLYLGCDAEISRVDEQLTSYMDSRWFGKNVHDVVEVGPVTLMCVYDRIVELKPILRSLSDMTEEEWSDIESKSSVTPDAWGYNGLRDNFIKAGKDYRFHWSIVNETLIELRKRGIDVDGLIESGLAIDKTKLPTNER